MKNIIKNLRISGFTLLELLVVIGIMGVMMALATVAYSATQRSGRDARRKQDMIAMQNALEQYYSANSFVYPATCSTAAVTHMKSNWPADPTNIAPYIYSETCATASYCICATMENATSGNATATTCVAGTFAKNSPYYCVGNLQ